MPKLLITGGRQRDPGLRVAREWHQYDLARAAVLDTDSGRIDNVLEWKTPADRCPPEQPSVVFKAGSWDGDHLLLCTQTEVLTVDPTDFRVLGELSHPLFNDVHHALRIDGVLHVVSTGLDAVITFDDEGHLLSYVSAVEEDRREAFPGVTDFRREVTTKPHAAHPNYIHQVGGSTWVTRFKQRDVARLDDLTDRHAIEGQYLHDGNVHGDAVWLTQVDGWLVGLDAATHGVRRRIELGPMSRATGALGWCRGVHVADGIAYVGFSRLRRTKLRANISWLKNRLSGTNGNAFQHPTRVVAYDLGGGGEIASWDLESAGVNAVFSLIPL